MSHNNGNLAEKRTRAQMSVVEGSQPTKKKAPGSGQAVRKKPTDGERQAIKKKPADGERQAIKKKPADGERQAIKKKPVDGEGQAVKKKPDTDRQAVKKKPVSDEKKVIRQRPEEEEIPAVRKKQVKKKTGKAKKQRSTNREESGARMSRRDEERAKRKAERLRKVRRQKITIVALSGVIIAAVACIAVFCTPAVKLARSLYKGEKYASKADYTNAQDAFEEALKIDTASVEAYHGMANNYLAQEKILEAEETYYTGWEQTKDEGLLHNYCIVLYNEAVAEINAKNCSLATVDKCIKVLETEPGNEDALNLMGTCYERLMRGMQDDEACMMFYDEDISQDTCSYGEYEQLLRRIMALQQSNPSEQMKAILTQYALIDMPYVKLSIPHMEQYMAVLTEINGIVNDAKITETLACLGRAKEVGEYFSTAFTEFETGNYAYARELVAEESYQQIRDDFITENSGYWEGSVYIPVNREQIVLHNEEGQVRFSFLSDEEYNNRQGVISVWGTKQEDDGVQRSVISYKPANTDGSESDTEYTIQYLYSNVKIKGQYVPQMNYRFDTKITTPEGITTNAIGDWGGEHEWEIDY